MSAISVYGHAMLENKTNYTELETSLMTASGAIFASSFVTFWVGLFALIVTESHLASKSRQTNQPIGYTIQSTNEEDTTYFEQIRDLPLIRVSKNGPLKITNPRRQFINDLQIDGDIVLETVPYTLKNVTDIQAVAFASGGINSLFSALSFFIAFEFISEEPLIKNSLAATAMLLGLLLVSLPINIFCFSTLFKTGISIYSSIPGTQFSGCFFSKSPADFRQRETNELYVPLLTEEGERRLNV